jgi:hypothetical protein
VIGIVIAVGVVVVVLAGGVWLIKFYNREQ